jgi:thymidine phosphorylase
VAGKLGLTLELSISSINGPVGVGIGPRLEALDVLSVLQLEAEAPIDLRDRSLALAGQILELTRHVPAGGGRRAAADALASRDALRSFERIRRAQGERELPEAAPHRGEVVAETSGLILEIDCWRIARVAKRAGAPAHPAAGVRLLRRVGETARAGEPLYEIHAQSLTQFESALDYARGQRNIFRLVPASAG